MNDRRILLEQWWALPGDGFLIAWQSLKESNYSLRIGWEWTSSSQSIKDKWMSGECHGNLSVVVSSNPLGDLSFQSSKSVTAPFYKTHPMYIDW